LGTIALTAVPAFQDTLEGYEADRAAAETAVLLRYARSLSLMGTPHEVMFDAAAGTAAVVKTSDGTPAPDPLRKTRDAVLAFGRGGLGRTRLDSADFGGSSRVSFDTRGSASAGGKAVLRTGSEVHEVWVSAVGGRVWVQ